MEYLFLMLAGIVYFAYAYLSFSDAFDKNSMMYFLTIMTVGFFYSFNWYLSTRLFDNKNDFFVFVMMWDFVYMAVFYFTPILLFGVKIDKWGLAGMASMIVGLLLMKLGHR
jgi:hypothetical protein